MLSALHDAIEYFIDRFAVHVKHVQANPRSFCQCELLVFVDCQFGLEERKMKGSTKPERMDEPFISLLAGLGVYTASAYIACNHIIGIYPGILCYGSAAPLPRLPVFPPSVGAPGYRIALKSNEKGAEGIPFTTR